MWQSPLSILLYYSRSKGLGFNSCCWLCVEVTGKFLICPCPCPSAVIGTSQNGTCSIVVIGPLKNAKSPELSEESPVRHLLLGTSKYCQTPQVPGCLLSKAWQIVTKFCSTKLKKMFQLKMWWSRHSSPNYLLLSASKDTSCGQQ